MIFYTQVLSKKVKIVNALQRYEVYVLQPCEPINKKTGNIFYKIQSPLASNEVDKLILVLFIDHYLGAGWPSGRASDAEL